MRILLTLVLLFAVATPAQAARPPVTAISNAMDHACALLADGTIKCWGANDHGQLGDGTRKRRLTPVPVEGIADAKAISTAYRVTCALLSGGTIECWGANRFGELGDGTKTTRLLPVPVAGIADAIAVAADYTATCALLADRTARCWGDNFDGGLGNGTRTASLAPVVVRGLTDAVAISYKEGHGCALISGGTVSCWGWSGMIGPDRSSDQLSPVPVAGVTGAIAIDADAFKSCALLQGGAATCWTTFEPPTTVTRFGRVKAYDWAKDGQQSDHSCGLFVNGTIKCESPSPSWGQLGNGKLTDKSTGPVRVLGIHAAVAISATDFYTCALLAGGTVRCWGNNQDGQLGDGTRKTRPAPVQVRGL